MAPGPRDARGQSTRLVLVGIAALWIGFLWSNAGTVATGDGADHGPLNALRGGATGAELIEQERLDGLQHRIEQSLGAMEQLLAEEAAAERAKQAAESAAAAAAATAHALSPPVGALPSAAAPEPPRALPIAPASSAQAPAVDAPPLAAGAHGDRGTGGLDPTSRWVAEHKILALTDEELRATPLDVMMGWYGVAQGAGTCDKDFGMPLVDRWRKAATQCCSAASSADADATSIQCHLAHQTRHAGDGDQLALLRNAAVNFRQLADGKTPAAYFKKYVDSRHNQEHSKIVYQRGTLSGTCQPNAAAGWQGRYFPGWNRHWFDAFQQRGAGELQCDVWEDAPTLIIERDTFANFFHNSEVISNGARRATCRSGKRVTARPCLFPPPLRSPSLRVRTSSTPFSRSPCCAGASARSKSCSRICIRGARSGLSGPKFSSAATRSASRSRLGTSPKSTDRRSAFVSARPRSRFWAPRRRSRSHRGIRHALECRWSAPMPI